MVSPFLAAHEAPELFPLPQPLQRIACAGLQAAHEKSYDCGLVTPFLAVQEALEASLKNICSKDDWVRYNLYV